MADTGIGLRSARGPVLGAIMLSTALVAMESTVIATAVPSIVADIGGFTEFPWLFSIYLLAQAVSVPVYGKLADLFGRKPVVLIGIGLFLAGSVGGGFAWNVWALIAFRVVQGLGAGAIMPTTITMLGDLYSVPERARVQGYIGSVWGVSSVLGPTVGGVFSEWLSWRWIFFVNIPLCLLAAATIWRKFDERLSRERPRVDYRGAALLTAGLTLVILGLLEGGQAWGWGSPVSVAVFGLGAALLVAFGVVERKVPEPVLPLWVFRRRLLVATGLASTTIGAVMMAITSYVPTYAQTVLGAGPLLAGLSMATLLLGWPIAGSQAGRVYLRIGFRGCCLIGSVVVLAGSLLLLRLDAGTSLWSVAVSCLVIGLGMGLVAAPSLVAAQSSVGWAERGVVTANNIFLRSVGSAVGVAVFGAVANAHLGSTSGEGADPVLLVEAVHYIFVGCAAISALMIVMILLMPGKDRPNLP